MVCDIGPRRIFKQIIAEPTTDYVKLLHHKGTILTKPDFRVLLEGFSYILKTFFFLYLDADLSTKHLAKVVCL